jgi:1-deoxy-D-xylulose-5-phosphate synthase
MSGLLNSLHGPEDLRNLSIAQMEQLASEIRARMIEIVAQTGGHISSNLGVTELTLALHRVFDFRNDRLLFDVGHQCYVHKLVTGRADRFHTLRQQGGMSGFPSITESEYDLFNVGHAGTAIATAVGMARADSILKRDTRVVALVGDASIVNGVAFEGLNQAGTLKRQFLVILNDNSMSIAKTQGGLAEHLARFRVSQLYEEVKRKAKDILPRVPVLGKPIFQALDHLKEGIKATVSPHQMFEQLGFVYVGPVDGHDIEHLIELLTSLKHVQHPVLLHVHTQKGRGCEWASNDPCTFHSPGKLVIEGGKATVLKPERKSWTTAFADAFLKLAADEPRLFTLTAAMPDGTGVAKVMKEMPDRALDCGIAESCTVDVAAGMCKAGMRPIAAIYSTFLQRGFDQVFQEVVLQGLPVGFCIDRAGFVGDDGAVHHGYLDIAYLRIYQNMVLMAPADEPELLEAMKLGLQLDQPYAIRYPRDNVPNPLAAETPAFVLGKSRVLCEGRDATLLAYGSTVPAALDAAKSLALEGVNVTVVNARFAKPVDEDMVMTAITRGGPVLTIEDHSVAGGFGSAVLETANRLGLPTESIVRLGHAENRFYAQATRAQQLAEAGIDAAGIATTVRRLVQARKATGGADTPIERMPTKRGS